MPSPSPSEIRLRMQAHLGVPPPLTATRSRVAEVVVRDVDDPVLSIVIVTYTTGRIVMDCIAAIAASLESTPYEVIVVDNAGDGRMPSSLRLRLGTSGVRLLTSTTNLGFGGGNELGMHHARGEVLCLLNPDAIVQPGWAEPLLACVADPAIGIAAPVLINPDSSVQEAGQTVDQRAITQPLRTLSDVPVADVPYSSAACWMMRRDVHELVGGFDAAYHPAYFEDLDFALRTQRAGFRTVVVSDSKVVHHQGTSTQHRPAPALAQQAIFRRRWATFLRQLPATA
jgi:GT2 family glycosyltransferase